MLCACICYVFCHHDSFSSKAWRDFRATCCAVPYHRSGSANFEKTPVFIEKMSRCQQSAIAPLDPGLFRPSAQRPVRVVVRQMAAATQVCAHRHPWAQAVFSDIGVVQVTMPNAVFIVPAQHAVLIPPDIEHCAVLLKDARLFSAYLFVPETGQERLQRFCRRSRVVKATPLLLELARRLAHEELEPADAQCYLALCLVTVAELQDAAEVAIGVPMPAERRLHMFCKAFLCDPQQAKPLAQLARDAGASVSTASRLFRDELGMTFQQWRQQVLFARALTLAAEGTPVGLIAQALGYSSASAFSAMVSKAFGRSPRELFARCARNGADAQAQALPQTGHGAPGQRPLRARESRVERKSSGNGQE